ncbi:family 4 glycosyl hydrolase [Tessaracoccus palaemonis]|uniref:6-phospho-beta-glucosidase n=1 Tax=Tessaracoccus palaemonis TaxID=2829499 RepID=A0ABX8SFX9_9ACTN|nr:6-phospho-beta-glucosidase [Tessaracoccus palaemonis]QXT61869.1 6-phospho-beta-glucosidase [Tessaracoccus palaemonis]
MKLVILGGGGFRVPLVYGALTGSPLIDEVTLYDSSTDRLRTIERIIRQLPAGPRLTISADLARSLTGADFVFAAIRVGGTAGRIADERVALGLGLLGQETIGPGGLAYALRTIPVMNQVAETIARVAPDAWTINFTNPAGIVTQAMRRVLGDRVVGICDTPIGLVKRVSRLLGVDLQTEEARVDYDYIGLNHLGWLRSVRIDGVDRLGGILADDAALDQIEEARLIGKDWVRATGALPNEYLYYYLHTQEAVASILDGGQTRGEFLHATQGRFYEAACCADSPLETWRSALRNREETYMAEARDEDRREEDVAGGGYQEVALRLMTAIATGSRERMILDVGNAHAWGRVSDALPDDVVVEVPCIVDADGPHPQQVAPLALDQLGRLATLRASEAAIMDAALTGSRDRAWEGFSIHPLVNSPALGAKLLTGYTAAHPEIASLFD